jgi:hypothetical protein
MHHHWYYPNGIGQGQMSNPLIIQWMFIIHVSTRATQAPRKALIVCAQDSGFVCSMWAATWWHDGSPTSYSACAHTTSTPHVAHVCMAAWCRQLSERVATQLGLVMCPCECVSWSVSPMPGPCVVRAKSPPPHVEFL